MTCTEAITSPSKQGVKTRFPSGVPALKEPAKQKIPLDIQASWSKGVISSTQMDLTDVEASKMLSTHGPLFLAATSFCQTFLEKAKETGIEVEDLQAVATSSEVNLLAFYRKDHDQDASDPWKSIDLKVSVHADAPQEELQMLADEVLRKQCPIKELLQDHFSCAVELTVNTYAGEKMQKIEDHYNVERYKVIGKTAEETAIKLQKLTCTYDPEEALFFVDVGEESLIVSASETVPVGEAPDNLPTPVQAFLFGCLSYYVETFVMRLGLMGYGLKSLDASFQTTMNNGIKDYDDGLDPFVFSLLGGKFHLDVKSDADEEVVQKAFLEAQIMAPSYLALAGSIDIDLEIEKM